MGISKFQGLIKQRFPNAVTPIVTADDTVEQSFYDHVYVDINVILHRIISISSTEDELLSRLCVYINNLLKHVVPLKTLTFATDGIAPFAKIILQRQRRQAYARNHKDLPEINPLCFTPGTLFMDSLQYRLSDYIESLKKIYKVTVSLFVDNMGEAEMKLIEMMIKNDVNKGTHCIYSSDADIYVIITAACIENVTVHNSMNLVNVSKIMDQHQKKLGKNKVRTSVCRDFAFTSLLMGNDYLPKLAYITLDKIWEIYIDTFKRINTYLVTVDGTVDINTDFFIKMLQLIVCNMSKKWVKSFKLDNFDVAMYKQYVFGLLWCFDTYRTGTCTRLDYMCNQNMTVHPLGLLYYFEFGYHKKEHYIENRIGANYDITPDIYATLILPKCARHLINYVQDIKFDHPVLSDKIRILYETEECKSCIKFHETLSNLNKLGDDKNAATITDNLKQYRHHCMMTHKDITVDNITELIDLMKRLQRPFSLTADGNKIRKDPVKIIRPMQKFKQVYLF